MPAWVESPFQLLSAAEYAHAAGRRIRVAMRLTGPQMETTAAELLRRGAPFAEIVPYVGIPWGTLARDRDWAIGDGFSGQFRAVTTALPPQHVTLLDDGANTLALADALLGRTPFHRPRRSEGAVNRLLGDVARHRLHSLADREALEIFTVFPLGDQRTAALERRGIRVTRHSFAWTRQATDPLDLPGGRVLLGSALPTDGHLDPDAYLRWVAARAREGEVVYLPHRRETPQMLAAVAELPGVRMLKTGLPVELVLAGIREPIELISLQTSAATTLELLLNGTGSVIRQSTVG
ncbi:hypothetical protein [Gryllotalpicola ginsengisoli]|uniref:hypothetical protein n=1 Tax=Gryllotalpicola ginsengisoli TaxID=444608 RepID=UPI0003B5E78E|nr:hypothetical protein [Gryllotalpicola ginsengisoli]